MENKSLGKQTAEILRVCAGILEQRSDEYSGVSDMFDHISELSNVEVSKVFDVLKAVKLSRLVSNPEHTDSLIDLINYFALQHVKWVGNLKKYLRPPEGG